MPHQVRSVSCFRECTEAFLLEVCALLHTELVVPNSFIAQTGDVTTGILILTKGEAHRRLKLRNSAPDTAAASLLAQHSTPYAAEPKGAREGAATSVSVSSFDLADLALSSLRSAVGRRVFGRHASGCIRRTSSRCAFQSRHTRSNGRLFRPSRPTSVKPMR